MKYISKRQVIRLHEKMIASTGGATEIRSENMLDSALAQIQATFDGQELYETLEKKAAQLAYALIQNHAFVDGNKRIGLFVMLIFLELNGMKLSFTQEELIELGLETAKGNRTNLQIHDWILSHQH